MKNYKRLSSDEREEISRMLAQDYSLNDIAKKLDRYASTISREILSGSCNKYTYRAGKAQRRAARNSSQRKKGNKILNNELRLKRYVYRKLRKKWSPAQIAKELKKDYPADMAMRIAPETIYAYLFVLPRGSLKKELLACLRQNRKRRHQQSRGVKMERKLEEMLSIEERPKEVEDRIIPGHWEGDLIIGKNNRSALGTLVERTTRTTILVPVKSKRAEEVARAFAKEDTNGLIRQFFPKGTDFNKVSRYEVKKAQHLLNGRPRAALDFQKPYEVFSQLINQNCCVR